MLGGVKTSEAKAKELRPYVEGFITRAKLETLENRRILRRFFSNKVVKNIFEVAKANVDRKGGYTRVVKTGLRMKGGASMAILELVK